MKINNAVVLGSLIIISMIAVSMFVYPSIPNKMAVHWGQNGNVNGTMPKEIGISIIPGISALILVALAIIPKIDPWSENIKKFEGYYSVFIVLMILFMLAIQMYILAWNTGIVIPANSFVSACIAVLFVYIGILLKKTSPNWFIGIRTPWTMTSERVWRKTNNLGGELFIASGLIALLGIIFPCYASYLILVPVSISAVYVVVYSYVEYKREENK